MSLTDPGHKPSEILTRGLRPQPSAGAGATTLRRLEQSLPMGWHVQMHRSWSELHDAVMYTVALYEPAMGWSGGCMSHDVDELVWLARRFVDDCMATTVEGMAYLSQKCKVDHTSARGQQTPFPEGRVRADDQCPVPDTGPAPGQETTPSASHGHACSCQWCKAQPWLGRQGAPQAHRGACPVCSGVAGAVMHVNCVMR